MRIPANSFDRADQELCRAHGTSVAQGRVMTASQPHDDAEWSRLWDRAEAIATFETAICMPADLPLPPSYWDDLEHWLKTLAPAKPATPQPCQAPAYMVPLHRHWFRYEQQPDGSVHDVEPEPAADVWHSEAPSVAGVYIAAAYDLCVTQRRYWNGFGWSQNWEVTDEAHYAARRRGNATAQSGIQWLRLVEADAPAKPVEQATHSVCIKAHGFADWQVGEMRPAHRDAFAHPECWLPCDSQGWIPHIPTADSVCPVPDGLRFEVRRRDGSVRDDEAARDLHHLWKTVPSDTLEFASDFVAWRPTGAEA